MLVPLGDRVIIEVVEVQEKSAGGIILREAAQEKPQEGKVVAVGAGVSRNKANHAPMLRVNDKVIFSKYAGSEIKYDNKEYLILREMDIMAIRP